MIGKKLIHYEITAEIGKGGMGEVYQARDTKLGRDVAIKVLPEEFALDTDRVARFQREAKLLASLNHPNIAAIYGLEESEGTHFLVMELIEGQTLNERIKSGPIPVEEALKLALQMAEALEAAHEKGVIHRDLKPANIKVTPDDKVKILDFGLAKAYSGDQENMSPMDSPTISAAATQQGVILGTAAYMSPEQARGETVDRKADIWAFGVVLFEMLTGRQAFTGKTVSDTLASVLAREPEWNSLPANLHWRLREVLERCLEKEAKNRYSGISDARVDIEKVLADPSGVFARTVTTEKPRKKPRLGIPWVAAIILFAIVGGIVGWNLRIPDPKHIVRFSYELQEDQTFSDPFGSMIALSPNGEHIAYSTTKGLYLRSLAQMEANRISGTEVETQQPFFSPDGQWIGYFSVNDRKLKKVNINGSVPVELCDVKELYGADWNEDNRIVFGDLSGNIMSIPSSGGRPESILKNESGPIIYPQILPGNNLILYTEITNPTEGNIVVQSIDSAEKKELFLAAYGAKYLHTGHIVYRDQNNLCAIPFDVNKLEITGGQISLIKDVGAAAFSDSGILAYIQGSIISSVSAVTAVWVTMSGKEEPTLIPPAEYGFASSSSPRISPDGTRVALTFRNRGNVDISIWDFAREIMSRITFDEGRDSWPTWTSDSKWIIYRTMRDDSIIEINKKAADGSGEVEILGSIQSSSFTPGPFSLSPDGKALLSWDLTFSPIQTDITMSSIDSKIEWKPLLKSVYNEDHPQISPDGKWLAYSSNESGQDEIYVVQFPDVNKGKWQVTTDGGYGPLWAPDGRALYYRKGKSIMSVTVETDSTFNHAKSEELFQGDYYSMNVGAILIPMWDIHPNGEKFLMMKPAETADEESTKGSSRKINMVLNWFEELKERVPVD